MIGANVNGIRIEDLFQCYDKYKFLYREKKEKMQYLFPMIKANWSMAIEMPWEHFLLLTYNRPEKELFASVSAWRTNSRSYCIQHMVSNQAENTRLILLHFINLLQQDIKKDNAIQVYYQPKTRFANNMFSFLAKQAGPNHGNLSSYSYLSYPLKPVNFDWASVVAEEMNHNNSEQIQQFVTKEKGCFYSWVQGLDTADYSLSEVNSIYQQYGLARTRKVVAFKNDLNEIFGVAIINKASAGLNFSMLENSCEMILNSSQPVWVLNEAIKNMLCYISTEYQQTELDYVPLLIDPAWEDLISAYGGKPMRTYDYFTCDNTVFPVWTDYLKNELVSVTEHMKMKNMETKAS